MDGSGMAVFVAKLPTFVKISKTKFQSLASPRAPRLLLSGIVLGAS